MRTLTKIKLINWHYFTNETIPIEGSALITGSNKAGKSTLIDALQVVIIANMKKIKFNSAAFDEKTERTLKGYLRGRTGTEGKMTYRRGENHFSSYIVLEITRTSTAKPYLIGVVFDYRSDTGEEDHVFFKIDEHPLEDDLFLDNTTPRNRQDFFLHLKSRGISFKQYRNDLEGYWSDLRQLFGGVKESFFSLFGKGISFKPITNLRKFVYDYILEERPVDVDTMRDYVDRYRQMENEIMHTESEIEALQEVCNEFEKVNKFREQEKTSLYMWHRGNLEQKKRELVEKEKEHQQAQKYLEECSREVRELEELHEDLKFGWGELLEAIRKNEVANREKELEQQIKELQNKLKSLGEKWKNLIHQVKIEIQERERLAQVLRRVKAPLKLTGSLLEDNVSWQLFLDEGNFPPEPVQLASSWNESLQWLIIQRQQWEARRGELETLTAELEQSIKDLKEKNQRLSSTTSTMKLKKLLQEHLVPDSGEDNVPVHVFCEAIDIRDRHWQNAIEGYLHTQKFDILVPPGYFDQALEIYERYKFTYTIESVGLVNTEKLIKKVKKPLPHSLAEEIIAQEDYVQAYANWLLGGIIKCTSEKELKKYNRAITASCMLYQNHTARQIPQKRYVVPYIGERAVKVQLAQKQEELAKCREELSLITQRLEEAEEVSHLEGGKQHLYRRWQELFTECNSREELEQELTRAQQELLSQDRSELDRLERRKKEKEDEIEQCENRIGDLKTEIGKTEQKLGYLKEDLETLASEKDDYRKQYLSYLEQLPEDLQEACHRKWELETQNKSPEILARNYRINIEGLQSKIKNQMAKVIKLRHQFSGKFEFLADVSAEDNHIWDERLKFLRETAMPEYKDKATEAREKAEQALKEHFLSRLHESIRLANEEKEELNRALKELDFGGYSYKFHLSPRPEMQDYYNMILDSQMGTGESLFSGQFLDTHGHALSRLFEEITSENEGFEKNAGELTDYRSYLDFDIIITDEQGNKSRFSNISLTESGGGAQIPFYVLIIASFYQAYHLYRNRDTLRLIVFDEAFNRMDADNIEECMRFIQKLGFQVLVVEPTGKIQQLVPYVNTNIIVMRDGFNSFVERVTRKKIQEWAEQELDQEMGA
jgi:uncharacterized protein YPO0396